MKFLFAAVVVGGITIVNAASAREWYFLSRVQNVCIDTRVVTNGMPSTPLDFEKSLAAEGRFDKTKIDRDKLGKIIIVEVWYINHGKNVLVPYFADFNACEKMRKAEAQDEGTPAELR